MCSKVWEQISWLVHIDIKSSLAPYLKIWEVRVIHHINPNIQKSLFIVPSLGKQLHLKSKESKKTKITSYLVQLIVHQLMGKPWTGLLFLKAFTWILFCCLVILIDTRPEIQSSKELLVIPTRSTRSCWKAGRYKLCKTPKIFLLLSMLSSIIPSHS